MKKLLPGNRDLQRWRKLVPRTDILFCRSKSERALLSRLGLATFSAAEAKAQVFDFSDLNLRSWYGYTLSRAKFCAIAPSGFVDSLERSLLIKIGRIQKHLKVPSIIPPRSMGIPKKKIISVDRCTWLTCSSWSRLRKNDQRILLLYWLRKNPRVSIYPVFPVNVLPDIARRTLQKGGMARLVNTFPRVSGPNCFSTAAAFFAEKKQKKTVRDLWMHGQPFLRYLNAHRFNREKSPALSPGDVLVFSKKGNPVHAGIYLGGDYVFEKSGQDFYEPYRLAQLSEVKRCWRWAAMESYRRQTKSV